MNYHIIPLNDLKPHQHLSTCECNPRVEIFNGNQLIIHNSFDGREGFELAQEILDIKMCNHPGCENEADCPRNDDFNDCKCMAHCDCNKYAYPEDNE